MKVKILFLEQKVTEPYKQQQIAILEKLLASKDEEIHHLRSLLKQQG